VHPNPRKLERNGLLYRYEAGTDHGLPSGEEVFGICSFWGVECLALSGNLDGAKQAFERLLT